MAVADRVVKIVSSVDAVKRLREFLAAQGFLGEVASKLIFVVRVEKRRIGDREYYEITARLPEMGPDGRVRVRTYRFMIDTVSGDVTGEPVEESEATP